MKRSGTDKTEGPTQEKSEAPEPSPITKTASEAVPLQDPDSEEKENLSEEESSFHSSSESEPFSDSLGEVEGETLKTQLTPAGFKDMLKTFGEYQAIELGDSAYFFFCSKILVDDDDDRNVHAYIDGYACIKSPSKSDRSSVDEFFLRALLLHNVADEKRLWREEMRPAPSHDSNDSEDISIDLPEAPKLVTPLLCAMVRWIEMHHQNKNRAALNLPEPPPKRTRSQKHDMPPVPSLAELQDYVQLLFKIYADSHMNLKKGETLQDLSPSWHTMVFPRGSGNAMITYCAGGVLPTPIVDWI